MLNLRPVWGIDIGDSALKAIKLKRVGKEIVLLDFHVIRYSELSGEPGARREAVLSEALAALQAAGFGRDPCIVSIAPQAIFSRFISLPPVDKRRIPEIVLYEARQQIPFSLNEVIWGYQTVRKEFIPGEEIEIGLFAVKRDVVDTYLAELSAIGRQLHGIQVAPLGLYNFIRHDVAFERPTVIMDIGAQSTDLLIIDGDKFWLRNLPIAGNSFTAILEKRLNIPREEAEKLKLAVAESRHRRKLLEVLRPVMRDLVGEVQRSIGYYKSLSQDVKFEEILVVGEGYRLFGLDRFLAERLQYKVSVINQLKNVLFQGSPDRIKELGEALPTLGVAIGLALQGLGQANVTIDLLPDDFVINRELYTKRFSGLIAAALVCGIVGCFYLKENRALKHVEEMERSGEQTLTAVENMKQEYLRAGVLADPKKLEMFEGIGRHRQYDARVVDAISRVVPRGIRIDKFTFTKTAAAGEFSGDALEPGRSRARSRPMPEGEDEGGGFMREALSEDERKVAAAKLTLSFDAWCAAEKEQPELNENLPKSLKRATIYPEGVKLVAGVVVGPITTTSGTRTEDGAVVEKPELTATITIGLLGPEEAAAALAKRREEIAKDIAARARESEAESGAEAEVRVE